MADQAVPQIYNSGRGGHILTKDGYSYSVTIGKIQRSLRETLGADELEDIDEEQIVPTHTPLYLQCRTCSGRSMCKQLQDSSLVDFQITRGKYICLLFTILCRYLLSYYFIRAKIIRVNQMLAKDELKNTKKK